MGRHVLLTTQLMTGNAHGTSTELLRINLAPLSSVRDRRISGKHDSALPDHNVYPAPTPTKEAKNHATLIYATVLSKVAGNH